MGLRQTLPVHKNNIVFIKNRAVKGGLPEANRQPETVNEECRMRNEEGRDIA
jgi:hypothetical protein